MKNVDYTGRVFGYCTAIRRVGAVLRPDQKSSHGAKAIWEVKCQCGRTFQRVAGELKRSVTCGKQCPIHKEKLSKTRTTHGLTNHKLFAVWRSMNDRCRLPSHHAWKNYGGRGITVCDRWQKNFMNFWEDMKPGWSVGLTLDRINNELGYSPENCRWATRSQQARNTRKSRISAETFETAKRNGVKQSTLLYRIDHGWSMEEASTTPPMGKRPSATYSTVGPEAASSSELALTANP